MIVLGPKFRCSRKINSLNSRSTSIPRRWRLPMEFWPPSTNIPGIQGTQASQPLNFSRMSRYSEYNNKQQTITYQADPIYEPIREPYKESYKEPQQMPYKPTESYSGYRQQTVEGDSGSQYRSKYIQQNYSPDIASNRGSVMNQSRRSNRSQSPWRKVEAEEKPYQHVPYVPQYQPSETSRHQEEFKSYKAYQPKYQEPYQTSQSQAQQQNMPSSARQPQQMALQTYTAEKAESVKYQTAKTDPAPQRYQSPAPQPVTSYTANVTNYETSPNRLVTSRKQTIEESRMGKYISLKTITKQVNRRDRGT